MEPRALDDINPQAASRDPGGAAAGGGGAAPGPGNGQTPFGAALEPVLRVSCDNRLSPVSWFRTDWQRGGALTGYATFKGDDDAEHPVVVKLPVPPRERTWLVRLQDAGDVVPRIFAHGEALGGYDMAWVVMERLPHGPIGSAWGGAGFDLVTAAIGRFYAASADAPLAGEPHNPDWAHVLDKARERVGSRAVPDAQRWKKALKKAHRKLPSWEAAWRDRPVSSWCHGDLHFGNAMTREPAPGGPALLLDFARVRPGHWLEDAVYFEHLYWADRERLAGRKICKQIVQARKQRGLPVDAGWAELARVKRALLAMSAPATLEVHGEPGFLRAALEMLETRVA